MRPGILTAVSDSRFASVLETLAAHPSQREGIEWLACDGLSWVHFEHDAILVEYDVADGEPFARPTQEAVSLMVAIGFYSLAIRN